MIALLLVACTMDANLSPYPVDPELPVDAVDVPPVVDDPSDPPPESPAMVDVLLVVERSPTMRDNEPTVTEGLGYVLDEIATWNTQWQVGAVLTDPYVAELVNDPIDWRDGADDRDAFLAEVLAVTDLDNHHAGLLASLSAWDRVPGFWRPGAEAVVIIVDDLDAHGYVDWHDAWVTRRPNQIPRLGVIVGEPWGGGLCYALDGFGYWAAADATHDICTWGDTWVDVLDAVDGWNL